MPTKKTLDYLKGDLDDMIYAVSSVITIVNSDDDPWLHGNLNQTIEFLQGLWDEGYLS